MTGYPSVDKPWTKYYKTSLSDVKLPIGSMYDYLYDCNKSQMDDEAVIYFHRTIKYKELFNLIDQVASAFIHIGVKAGDIVTVSLPNIPENIFCLYALNKIGAVVDFIDLRIKGQELVEMLQETDSKFSVICNLFAQNYFEIIDDTSIDKMIVVSPFDSLNPLLKLLKDSKIKLPKTAILWKDFLKMGTDRTVSSVGKDDTPACIFHTSGTTGKSKGAVFTNQSCNAMALQAKHVRLRFESGKRMMNQVPPFLAFNIICSLHLPMAQHMKMVLLPDYRPDQFAKRIVKTKAAACLAGPADWGNFLESKQYKKTGKSLSLLVTPLCGSDAISDKTKQAINEVLRAEGSSAEIYEGYGMTEIGSAACANSPGAVKPKSVGIPLCFNSFCIWDNEKDEELSYNEIGEICMTGPTLMKEYYNNLEETKSALRMHHDGQIWLHSGDLGRIDEDGFVYIEGRLKRIIVKHNGLKVSPFEIEKTIMKSEYVTECCAVGVHDEEHGMGFVPVAWVVMSQKSDDENEVRKHLQALCSNNLTEKYQPKHIHFIKQLPLTPNGKVDYRKLEKLS